MATMNREIYEALKEAQVSDEKALKAAESVASFDARFAKLEAEFAVIKWMLGTNIAISLAVLWRLLK